jgi:hypothetical protein
MRDEIPKAFDFKSSCAPKGFTNINDLFDLSAAEWLHPVQSLFGDWDANILILGQDFNGLKNLINLEISKIHHDTSFETNKNLINVFGKDTSAMYANFFWFIKDGFAQENFSIRKEVISANMPIFHATLQAMKNLTHIFPLGSLTTKSAFNIKFEFLVESTVDIKHRSYRVLPIPHLGRRGLLNFCRKGGMTKDAALLHIKNSIESSLSR